MREPRLGDDIDDFCVRCKRVMNHAIVSVVNAEPAKVRCRTCHSDHDFRHEQPPPPKVDPRKQALFDDVLKKVNPGAEVAVPDPDAALADPGAALVDPEGALADPEASLADTEAALADTKPAEKTGAAAAAASARPKPKVKGKVRK